VYAAASRERSGANVNAAPMPIRLAASLAAAALLCACSGQRSASETATAPSTAPTAPPSAAASAPSGAAAAPSGPANAPVARAGTPGGIPLDPAQRAELRAVAAKEPPAVRDRLRYALAAGEDGKTHLVVYDGEGLPADGRDPRKPHEYIVFRVLNSARGEHYDPQQNALIAPLPTPDVHATSGDSAVRVRTCGSGEARTRRVRRQPDPLAGRRRRGGRRGRRRRGAARDDGDRRPRALVVAEIEDAVRFRAAERGRVQLRAGRGQ
jgi:hypothetical protein